NDACDGPYHHILTTSFITSLNGLHHIILYMSVTCTIKSHVTRLHRLDRERTFTNKLLDN
ncbi:unnamed protein product, partial [Hermetia illucens]